MTGDVTSGLLEQLGSAHADFLDTNLGYSGALNIAAWHSVTGQFLDWTIWFRFQMVWVDYH